MEISWLYYAQLVVIPIAIILYLIWLKIRHRKNQRKGKGFDLASRKSP